MKLKIHDHFKRAEFACACGCGFDAVDVNLLHVLVVVREEFRQPVTILSGCRCRAHNAAMGGAPNSQHCLGKAADISVRNTSPEQVHLFLSIRFMDMLGLGRYKTFVHVDVRDTPARWHDDELSLMAAPPERPFF